MAAHNTARTVSYHLAVREDQWVVWCVMLLFRARLLTGNSTILIDPIVKAVRNRKRIKKPDIKLARRVLGESHTLDLACLLNQEAQRC